MFFCTMLGCTTYFTYKAIRPQIALNGVNYYKDKHKIIAINKNEENIKIKSKLYIYFIYILIYINIYIN